MAMTAKIVVTASDIRDSYPARGNNPVSRAIARQLGVTKVLVDRTHVYFGGQVAELPGAAVKALDDHDHGRGMRPMSFNLVYRPLY